MKSECCFIGEVSGFQCGNEGEWRIFWTPFGLEDYTESCTRHVGEMLTDAVEHRIFSIEGLETLLP